MNQDCSGSYGDAVSGTTKHGKRLVTGECPKCGKRVAYVTAHGLENKPRVLGLHKGRLPRTVEEAKADPRVLRVYQDSDGWWIDLRDGFKNTYDEPCGALHGIHEDRLRDALRRFSGIKPCDCPECVVPGKV